MKAKRGVTIRWKHGRDYERIPFERACLIIWHDRFGTVHVAGWGKLDPDKRRIERAVREVMVAGNLNPIIEP